MTYATMTKDELRTACKAVGIAYGKLNTDAMRAALAAVAPAPHPETPTNEEEPPSVRNTCTSTQTKLHGWKIIAARATAVWPLVWYRMPWVAQ